MAAFKNILKILMGGIEQLLHVYCITQLKIVKFIKHNIHFKFFLWGQHIYCFSRVLRTFKFMKLLYLEMSILEKNYILYSLLLFLSGSLNQDIDRPLSKAFILSPAVLHKSTTYFF